MKTNNYMTVREAAEELGLKYKTLLKRISVGTVEAERLGAKLLVIRRATVIRLKRKQSGAS